MSSESSKNNREREREMSCYKVERSQDQRKLLINELSKGHKLACQLVALLEQKTCLNNEQVSMIQEIMGSFHSALKALDSGVKSLQNHKQNENPLQMGKIQSAHATGGQKTRSHPYTCTLTKSKCLNDGHSWRKYGQKKILNVKFPRSYFRCSHKYDQGCKATRQVQQAEQDPSTFIVTYFGEHTCRDPFKVVSSCIEEDPSIINFASPSKFDANFKQPQFSILKEEDSCEDVVNNIAIPGSSLSNCFKFPEFGGISEDSGMTSRLQSSADSLSYDLMEESFGLSEMLSLLA